MASTDGKPALVQCSRSSFTISLRSTSKYFPNNEVRRGPSECPYKSIKVVPLSLRLKPRFLGRHSVFPKHPFNVGKTREKTKRLKGDSVLLLTNKCQKTILTSFFPSSYRNGPLFTILIAAKTTDFEETVVLQTAQLGRLEQHQSFIVGDFRRFRDILCHFCRRSASKCVITSNDGHAATGRIDSSNNNSSIQ
jgi:hypothetical protein